MTTLFNRLKLNLYNMKKISIINSSIVLCPLGYYFTLFNDNDEVRYCSADEDEYYETYDACIEALHCFIN